VVARIREHVVVAGMIPVHVGADDMIDLAGLNADRAQPLVDRIDDLA